MSTSSCISRVRRGRLAPRKRATGPPRAQNRKVGRISLKSKKSWSYIAQFRGLQGLPDAHFKDLEGGG